MDFTIEKQYIIKLLFNNLQLDVPEEVGLDKNYKFRYENKVLEINDSFFSRIPASDSYLKRENIPDEVIWIDDPQSEKEKIPGLYGENKMIFEEDYILWVGHFCFVFFYAYPLGRTVFTSRSVWTM